MKQTNGVVGKNISEYNAWADVSLFVVSET